MRLVSAGVAFALLITLTGCCVQRCAMTGDVAGPCADGGCADADCAGGECDSCGTCGPPCGGLFSPFHYMLGCGSGCGEFYYDEWLSDPPQCCDPCDNCGNWVGPVGSCRWYNNPLNACNLWGTRHVCQHCASSEPSFDGEVVVDEQWSDEMVAPEAPPDDVKEAAPKKAPSKTPKEAKPQKSALKSRTVRR